MRIAITGEKGFIAKNLAKEIQEFNKTFVSLDNSRHAESLNLKRINTGEICVHSNSVQKWMLLLENETIDVLVHNAAVVGTDVVALNHDESTKTNILGTQNLIKAANELGILIVYTGTTVIYDTFSYQESEITENSIIHPRTDYAIQKYAAEMMIRNNSKDWLVVRPLFAYGGEGDMNSLIAKSLFGIKNDKKNIDMFLNPEKIKDYMHVKDFCNAVMTLIDSDIRNDHFNISAQNPHNTLEIIELIKEVTGHNLDDIIKWHPTTDYLGNHRLSFNKFKSKFNFQPFFTLKNGIRHSWNSIQNANENYNPLKYLEEAAEKDIDLLNYFPPL